MQCERASLEGVGHTTMARKTPPSLWRHPGPDTNASILFYSKPPPLFVCDFLHGSKYKALTSMTFVSLLMSACWGTLQKYMHFPYSSFIWSMLYIQSVLCIVHTGNTLVDIRKFNVNKLWNKWTFLLLFDSRSGNWIPRQHHHRHCLPPSKL